MKYHKLMDYIGQIDDNIIAEAETSNIRPRTKIKFVIPKRMSIIAACIALVFIFTFVAYLVYPHKGTEITETPLMGKTFSSISDIPVEKIGDNYLDGCNGNGPVEVFTTDGEFYFSMVTRWVGDDVKQETVNYYTLFRYEPKTGISIAVSDEVGYISMVDGRFIYDRSNEYLTRENRWKFPYYSNNAQWNDEQEINGDDAKTLLNCVKGVEQILSKIMIDNQPVSGTGAYIGDDGFIYTINQDTTTITSVKLE